MENIVLEQNSDFFVTVCELYGNTGFKRYVNYVVNSKQEIALKQIIDHYCFNYRTKIIPRKTNNGITLFLENSPSLRVIILS